MDPLISLLLLLQAPAAPRKPVPEAAKLVQAEKLVREVLKDDFAKSGPAERKALARKLFQQGRDVQDDPAVSFFLLKSSRTVAAELGDIEAGLEAVDALALAFEVDILAEKHSFLSDASKGTRLAATHKSIAEALIGLSAEASRLEAFEVATASSELAVASARWAKNIPLLAKAEAARKDVEGARLLSDRLKAAKEALLKDPEDAPANLVVGLYECVTRGKWSVGLPYLAKGSDSALKEAAARDLAAPEEAADQLRLADAWWGLAEKDATDEKNRMRKRAGYWYLKARGRLSGLHRVKADKRIEALGGLDAEEESPDILGHWTFDEGMGATATDHAGRSGTMSLIDGGSWNEGRFGTALDLNGTSAHALVADIPALNFGTDSFSVACFIRLRRTSSARLVNKWHHGTETGWIFDANSVIGQIDRPGALRVRLRDGNANVDHSVEAGLQVDTWTHVALVVDRQASEIKLFARGEMAGSPQSLGPVGSVSAPAPLAVGYVLGTPRGRELHGSIDELRIYRRALSAAEIKTLAARP